MTKELTFKNKKAYFDYNILKEIEAGVVLTGTEIKAIRTTGIQLKEGFVQIKGNEAWLNNVHISEFKEGNIFNHEPLRTRKLLLHKKEIKGLQKELSGTGMTIVPLKAYFNHGKVKILIGLAKGKKDYDKRESLKAKDQKRDIARQMKDYR